MLITSLDSQRSKMKSFVKYIVIIVLEYFLIWLNSERSFWSIATFFGIKIHALWSPFPFRSWRITLNHRQGYDDSNYDRCQNIACFGELDWSNKYMWSIRFQKLTFANFALRKSSIASYWAWATVSFTESVKCKK